MKLTANPVTATRWARWIPALGWLRSYQKGWLRFDVVAGLSTSAVVIPKAMAYAAIAGLPLEVGLYTSLIPLVVYAVLGTSRPLSVTTSSTIAIMAVAIMGGLTVATVLTLFFLPALYAAWFKVKPEPDTGARG